MNYVPLDKKISKMGLVCLLSCEKAIASMNFDIVLLRLNLRSSPDKSLIIRGESPSVWAHNYKLKYHCEEYIYFDVAYNAETYTHVLVKKAFKNKDDKMHRSRGEPSEVDYHPVNGSIVSEKFHEHDVLLKTNFYTYDKFGDDCLEKRIVFTENFPDQFGLCIEQMTILDDIVMGASFSFKNAKNRETANLDLQHLNEVCHHFNGVNENAFLDTFKTITADQVSVLKMMAI